MSNTTANAEILVQTIGIIQLTSYFDLSSMSLFIYDFVLTYNSEITLMRKMGLGMGKMLYFTIRYFTLASTIFANAVSFSPGMTLGLCTAWSRFYWISGVILWALSEVTLALRVCALYNRSQKITTLVTTTITVASLLLMVVLVVIVRDEEMLFVRYGDNGSKHICAVSNMSTWYILYWVPATASEILLFGLALYKGIDNIRMAGLKGASERLTMILVRDSVLYFFMVSVLYLSALLVWIIKGKDYIALLAGPTLVLEGIMSQRLLLNIREWIVYARRDNRDAATTIDFSARTRGAETTVNTVPEETFVMSSIPEGSCTTSKRWSS